MRTLWCTGTIHSADAAAPQRAADALARHGVRVRSRLGRRDVRDVLARRGTVHHQPRQAHSERLWHTCTHAPTQRGHACRAHGRTTCTQEHPRWPISARARPGRHAASQLAADVAAPKTGAPAGVQRVDRCSSQIDSGTAVDRGRARIESPSRGMAAPPRARCTQPPSPKGPYPVGSDSPSSLHFLAGPAPGAICSAPCCTWRTVGSLPSGPLS